MSRRVDFGYHDAPPRQRGATLVVALIFLLLLTMLGVSTMSTTSLQERMAGNLQSLTQAFQAAETGIARVLSDEDLSERDTDCTDENYTAHTTPIGASGAIASTTDTCQDFLQRTTPTRSPEPQGQETVAFNHFEIQGVGRTSSNARSRLTQGIRFLGPASGDILVEEGP